VPAILFIDDKPEQVDSLIDQVRQKLGERNVELRSWVPRERDPRKAFDDHLSTDTTLVVTDQDLTEAQLGLFGSTIVEWCQQRAVPVADYSRALGEIKKEPDLFEIRVPRDERKTASFVTGVFHGFDAINNKLEEDNEIALGRSPAAVLARVVNAPDAEADFALYAIRLASASGALTSRVMAFADPSKEPSDKEKRAILAYIVGHLLLNSVLRYPGPILSLRALEAYLATNQAGDPKVLDLFKTARYDGPFAELDTFHWLGRVDEILEPLIPEGNLPETNGELHRHVIERALNTELERHPCPERCKGQNGGYLCPFTQKTVCIRADCSVGSNSWIPQGARICRIEREFFDEWAPVLGL
jgi:hypothetical protein